MPLKMKRARTWRAVDLNAEVVPISEAIVMGDTLYGFFPVIPPRRVKARVFDWRWV